MAGYVKKKGSVPGHKVGKQTIQPTSKGQKPITYKAGGLHGSTKTKPGMPISPAKHEAARSGKLGPKAKKQELFFENVLTGRKKNR